MAVSSPRLNKLRIQYGSGLGAELRRLDSGGALMAPFRAVFVGDQIKVTMVVDVADGAPVCRSYQVERTDGGGLEFITTEIMRGLNLRTLLANVCARVAMEQVDDSTTYTAASSVEAVEAVIGPIRRRRVPVTDESLQRFSAAYKHRFEAGRMPEFADGLGYSERQAWRLLKLARERGFLPRKAD